MAQLLPIRFQEHLQVSGAGLFFISFALSSGIQAHVSATVHRTSVKILLSKITILTVFAGKVKRMYGRFSLVVLGFVSRNLA